MGQAIEILKSTVLGDVAIFDTDRSLTGMDGHGFRSKEEAAGDSAWAGLLAGRIFAADPSVGNVYVYSNTISVQRKGGWSDADRRAIASVIAAFFIVYEENKAG